MDVVNIEVNGKVVRMLCAPYKDPQDPLKLLEALDTDMIILNANLAGSADHVSPVVMAKLIDNPEPVLVIYGDVQTVWDALQTVLETPGIAANVYRYEKVQVCSWLPAYCSEVVLLFCRLFSLFRRILFMFSKIWVWCSCFIPLVFRLCLVSHDCSVSNLPSALFRDLRDCSDLSAYIF